MEFFAFFCMEFFLHGFLDGKVVLLIKHSWLSESFLNLDSQTKNMKIEVSIYVFCFAETPSVSWLSPESPDLSFLRCRQMPSGSFILKSPVITKILLITLVGLTNSVLCYLGSLGQNAAESFQFVAKVLNSLHFDSSYGLLKKGVKGFIMPLSLMDGSMNQKEDHCSFIGALGLHRDEFKNLQKCWDSIATSLSDTTFQKKEKKMGFLIGL